MQNKAQSEIIGLAVVVIIIVVASLFAVVFLLKPSQRFFVEEEEQELASKTLNSIIYTKTNCDNHNMDYLIKDCSIGGSTVCANLETSCNYVKTNVKQLLDNVFGKTGTGLNRDFYFKIQDFEDEEDFSYGTPCSVDRDKERVEQPLYITTGSTLTITLDLCR